MNIKKFILISLFLGAVKAPILEVCTLAEQVYETQLDDQSELAKKLMGEFNPSEVLPHKLQEDLRCMLPSILGTRNRDEYVFLSPQVSEDLSRVTVQAVVRQYEVVVFSGSVGNGFSFWVSPKAYHDLRETMNITEVLPKNILELIYTIPDIDESLNEKILESRTINDILYLKLNYLTRTCHFPQIPDGIAGIESYMNMIETRKNLNIEYTSNQLFNPDHYESQLIIPRSNRIFEKFIQVLTADYHYINSRPGLFTKYIQKRRAFEEALEEIPPSIIVVSWNPAEAAAQWRDGDTSGEVLIIRKGGRGPNPPAYFSVGMKLRDLMELWWRSEKDVHAAYWADQLRQPQLA